jgi:hypothetical protein
MCVSQTKKSQEQDIFFIWLLAQWPTHAQINTHTRGGGSVVTWDQTWDST